MLSSSASTKDIPFFENEEPVELGAKEEEEEGPEEEEEEALEESLPFHLATVGGGSGGGCFDLQLSKESSDRSKDKGVEVESFEDEEFVWSSMGFEAPRDVIGEERRCQNY